MEEIWKSLDFIDRPQYKISSFGRVFSKHSGQWRKLKPVRQYDGYLRVVLSGKSFAVHRLVALAFLKNDSNKPFVLHKDGTRDNNKLDNLYFGDTHDNIEDAIRHGTWLRGESHPNSIFTECDIISMRERFASGDMSQVELAREYDTIPAVICDITRGKSWAHVSGPTSNRGKRKLSNESVIEIRSRYRNGNESQRHLATCYKVSQRVIQYIVSGVTYKDVL